MSKRLRATLFVAMTVTLTLLLKGAAEAMTYD